MASARSDSIALGPDPAIASEDSPPSEPPGPALTVEPDAGPAPVPLSRLLLHTIGALALFLAALLLLSSFYRGELQAVGRLFVARLGPSGLFLGTLLADWLSFPVPPQFYLLTAHLGGEDATVAVLCVSAASVLGGHLGYHLSRWLGAPGGDGMTPGAPRWPLARLGEARARTQPLFDRYGHRAVFWAAFLPIPYSLLCYAAGLYRMPYALFGAFTLLRVPRILLYYLLIRLGWR